MRSAIRSTSCGRYEGFDYKSLPIATGSSLDEQRGPDDYNVRMSEPRRPSFLSWILVAVLAAPVLYVLSDGPAMYAVKRRWITMDAFLAVWGPLPECVGAETVDAYEAWWCELAYGHGGSD